MDTRDALREAARDPERGWAQILPRIERKLRVLYHFRTTPELRAAAPEDDLIQEVFAEMLAGIHRFQDRGPGSLERWLAGILRHRIEDARTSERRRPKAETALRRLDGSAETAFPGLLQAVEDSRAGVTQTVAERERIARVRRVIESLSPRSREAILLKIYEGRTGRECADLLGIDESTFSYRMKRALDSCRVSLKDMSS
ncbi:MAG: RNA polymerase sigma factor [Planctomycetota bacterium]